MKIAQITRFAVSALMSAALFAALPASAQQATAPKAPVIGVVDTDFVITQSLAGKQLQLEREKYLLQYQNQVKAEDAALRAKDQELTQQRTVVAQDVFEQRAKAFQQELQTYQDKVRDKQERLEFVSNQAGQAIYTTMYEVAQEVAKERGVNAMLPRGMMLVFDPSMDLTKPVLDKLNARMPTVAFQNPDTLPAPGAAPAPAAAAKPAATPAKK